ncbi:MAG TPA: signal peptidase II [Fredinandcohnia sp.]|nr:signal peptidase II [Fredinandcohnia sp.]
MKSNWILASTLFVGTLVLDAVTKALALAHLADGPIFLGADWLALRLAFNEGVAFSFLEGIPYWMLGAGAIVLLALVLWNLRDLLASRIGASALGLVAAGGLGNAVDRLWDGKVTDMISVWLWPVFNVADIAITVGVGLLLLSPRASKKVAPTSPAEAADES